MQRLAPTIIQTPHGDEMLHVTRSVDVPKVRQFLESKARQSAKTAETYCNAISALKKFLEKEYPAYTVETILKPLHKNKIDIYKLMDAYVSHLKNRGQTPGVYVSGVKKYFGYHDIYIIPEKFKNRVTVPAPREEERSPLERDDVRRILLAITNRRLRPYCFCKSSGGFRATEGLAIQNSNLQIGDEITKAYMKAKYSKNKLPREIYFSYEGTEELVKWLRYKYGERDIDKILKEHPHDYVFAIHGDSTPRGMYSQFRGAFQDVLSMVNMKAKQVGEYRHDITLHSLRAFVETTIEDHTSANYADYILGHKKSTYYRHKEPERKRMYIEKCLPQLVFLDYEKLEKKIRTLQVKVDKVDELAAKFARWEKEH